MSQAGHAGLLSHTHDGGGNPQPAAAAAPFECEQECENDAATATHSCNQCGLMCPGCLTDHGKSKFCTVAKCHIVWVLLADGAAPHVAAVPVPVTNEDLIQQNAQVRKAADDERICPRPAPSNHAAMVGGHGAGPGASNPKKRKADAELRALLQEWKLEGEAEHLAEHGGVTSLEGLADFDEGYVGELRLPVLQAGYFRKMLKHVKAQLKNKKEPAASFEQQLASGDLTAQGNVHAIVEGMRDHSQDSWVQEHACQALCTLCAVLDSTQFANIATQIAGDGGIEQVVAAMATHPNAVRVQEKACQALRNIAGGLFHQNAANKAQIAGAGGIERVVAAMGAHPGAVEFQYHACEALLILSSNAGVAERIKTAGGLVCINHAILACGAMENGWMEPGQHLLAELNEPLPEALPEARRYF